MDLKLKDVLPEKHIEMLTPKAKELTRDELNQIMSQPGLDHHGLEQEDIDSLTKLSITRINEGMTMFGFPTMSVEVDNEGGPNRNW